MENKTFSTETPKIKTSIDNNQANTIRIHVWHDVNLQYLADTWHHRHHHNTVAYLLRDHGRDHGNLNG